MTFNKIKAIKIGTALMFSCLVALTVYQYFFGITIKPQKTAEFSKTSVMITRYDGRSGGSGVIISSGRHQSKVLTNAHVCNVVKKGGIVRTDDQRGMVEYYQVSQVHDLCLITINTNFKVNTVLASQEPVIYDESIVSGHPILYPNLVTKGHFSGKELITIMTGLRKCTEEEQKDPNISFLCMLLGGMPVVRTYEAQVISNTIQPGSSGSAVFNSQGEISGLVFAGSGNFGYGLIVPYPYLANFFDTELETLDKVKPTDDGLGSEVDMNKTDWKKVCYENLTNPKIAEVCNLVNKSLLMGF